MLGLSTFVGEPFEKSSPLERNWSHFKHEKRGKKWISTAIYPKFHSYFIWEFGVLSVWVGWVGWVGVFGFLSSPFSTVTTTSTTPPHSLSLSLSLSLSSLSLSTFSINTNPHTHAFFVSLPGILDNERESPSLCEREREVRSRWWCCWVGVEEQSKWVVFFFVLYFFSGI